jgi:hypothetical protein
MGYDRRHHSNPAACDRRRAVKCECGPCGRPRRLYQCCGWYCLRCGGHIGGVHDERGAE